MEQLAASGDREGVVTTIFRRLLGMTDDELDRYRALPSREARVALADVNVREARRGSLRVRSDAVRGHERSDAPASGGDSPPGMRAIVDMVDAAPTAASRSSPASSTRRIERLRTCSRRESGGFVS
ncbi:MAG: hypothetical protein M3O70_04265 [Actinomycetota bacterium]|nr:hypothetical protein [Actinomycetota bacterium]